LRARQRERTRDALLGAGERCFSAAGFVDATVEQIAADAQVSVRSLYNTFGGKYGLYLAVVEQAMEANRRYMSRAWEASPDPLEQILAASDAYLLFHLEHPGYFKMVALPRELPGGDAGHADIAERIAQRVESEVGRVEQAIRRGISLGRFRDVDAALAAQFLWGAWNGVIALGERPDRLRAGDEEITAILGLGRRLVLEGLAVQDGPAKPGRVRGAE
jgi:AcrR family transcriptional regulator